MKNLQISFPFTIFVRMEEGLIPAHLLEPALKLSDRERKFCEGIAEGLSGAEAIREAGYTISTPSKYATELRRKKKINDEILRLVAEREGYAKVDETRVLKEFMTIVNADIADYIDDDGFLFSPEKLKEMPPHKTRAIQSIKQTVDKGKVVTEVKLYDKLVALDKVARHVNFYKDDEEGNKKPVVNLVLPGALVNIS